MIANDLVEGHRIADHLLDGEHVMICVRTMTQARAGLPFADPHLVLVSGAALAADDPATWRTGLVRALRDEHQDVLILIVVDEPADPETMSTSASGADDFIVWPINQAMLRARLWAHIRWTHPRERGSGSMAATARDLAEGVRQLAGTAWRRLLGSTP